MQTFEPQNLTDREVSIAIRAGQRAFVTSTNIEGRPRVPAVLLLFLLGFGRMENERLESRESHVNVIHCAEALPEGLKRDRERPEILTA